MTARGEERRLRLTSPGTQVHLYQPTDAHPYFRMVWQDPESGRRRQTSAGRDLARALERAEDLERKLVAADSSVAGARTFGDLVDAYTDPARPKFESLDHRKRSWSPGYTTNISRRAQRIHDHIGSVRLEMVNQRHIYKLVNAESTYHQALGMRTTLRAIVGFGVKRGYLRQDQHNLASVDIVVMPGALHRVPAPPEQGEDVQLLTAAEVPSLEAVTRLASAPVPYPHWQGLVELLAHCGPRIHEALALTSDDVVCDEQSLMPRLRVARQAVEPRGGGVSLTAPKNGHARTVSVITTTTTGFPLAEWIVRRAQEASVSANGSEPELLFPSPRAGSYWRLRNLRKRVFVPAAEHADWEFHEIQAPSVWRADGGLVRGMRTHRAWVHTLHSLRHYFATVAIDNWHWAEDELCLAGGWHNEEFVRRRYYGRTTEVTALAQRKQLAWLQSSTQTDRRLPQRPMASDDGTVS